MNQLPDAPWIRDAEQNGYPSADPVECPICGWDCDTIYLDRSGVVCGCDLCMKAMDVYEWSEEQKEADRDDT